MGTELLTPTTKLEAINWALEQVSLPPLNTLEGNIGRDAAVGLRALDIEVRALCRKGYWFSRRDVTLSPTVGTNYLVLPSNALTITRPSETCSLTYNRFDWDAEKPVIRQGKVFSVIRQSYAFPKGLTVQLYEALPFEDTPEEARAYCTVVAALAINQAFMRSEQVTKDLSPLLNLTYQELLAAEIENSKYRMT